MGLNTRGMGLLISEAHTRLTVLLRKLPKRSVVIDGHEQVVVAGTTEVEVAQEVEMALAHLDTATAIIDRASQK